LRRFYYDTVTYDPLVIDIVRQRVGADRILFGSDYPFGDADPLALIDSCSFDTATRSAITHGNAAALIATTNKNKDGARP
jgi:aminocarboxymuconate-semialdehyde decarboxylase